MRFDRPADDFTCRISYNQIQKGLGFSIARQIFIFEGDRTQEKKLIAFLLAAVLLLSLCACGGKTESSTTNSSETQANDLLDKNDVSNYIGVWASEHMKFTFNKGGTGRYEQPNTDNGFYDFTYEIKDEVLVLTMSRSITYVASFELSDDGSSITILQNGLPTFQAGETEFQKQ